MAVEPDSFTSGLGPFGVVGAGMYVDRHIASVKETIDNLSTVVDVDPDGTVLAMIDYYRHALKYLVFMQHHLSRAISTFGTPLKEDCCG